jgi:hypothetical protein
MGAIHHSRKATAMSTPTLHTLVQARDQLTRDGHKACSFLVLNVGLKMLHAGEAIDDVILLATGGAEDYKFGLRRAAHRAMGRLEALSAYQERFDFAEAYQTLLALAYA